MKKLFQLGAIFCSLLVTQVGYADQNLMQDSSIQQSNLNQAQDPSLMNGQSRAFRDEQVQDQYYQQRSTSETGPYSYSIDRSNYEGINGTYNVVRGDESNQSYDGYYSGYDYTSNAGECPEDHPCDQPCGDCWCMYCHYEPCYYNTYRCIEEEIPCKKRCCRYCPREYEVTRCRYVPQLYTETCCRNELEYYWVDDSRCCKKWVCDRHCQWKPCYYWKHTCGDPDCKTECPQQGYVNR